MARFGSRLRRRITKLSKLWNHDEAKSSHTGTARLEQTALWSAAFAEPSRERLSVYQDVYDMDSTVEEVATALDILADNATSAERGEESSFIIAFDSQEQVPEDIQRLMEDTVKRTKWRELAYTFTRYTLCYGDTFYEYVVNEDLLITRLMLLPVETMVRNEDAHGVLRQGNTVKNCAFEQVDKGTSSEIPIATFYPWQVEHIRWNHGGTDKYGRPLMYTARTAWLKLRAMEEALVINWLTRAFARLLFLIDITGKSDVEAAAYIADFQKSLQRKRISSGAEVNEELSVVKDIFMGKRYHEIAGDTEEGLADVKVLDTSNTGFTNLGPVKYYLGKILTATRVPKAHLGLEEDVNAKATLQLQDKRFARTVRSVQRVMSSAIRHTLDLQLLLQGLNPADYDYNIQWPVQSWSDEVDIGNYYRSVAKAAEGLIKDGIVDQEWAAKRFLYMTPNEWIEVSKRIPTTTKEEKDAV